MDSCVFLCYSSDMLLVTGITSRKQSGTPSNFNTDDSIPPLTNLPTCLRIPRRKSGRARASRLLFCRSGDPRKWLAIQKVRTRGSYLSSTVSLCYPGCQLVMSVGWRQASSCPLYLHGLTKKTTCVRRKGCVNTVPRSEEAR